MTRTSIRGRLAALVMPLVLAICAGLLLSACAKIEISPAFTPVSNETMHLLGQKGMSVSAPIFVRIFKEESELEVWKLRDDGHYYHFKTYPICNWSGDLGPKVNQGDMQAPEGFYGIGKDQMNPNSQFYLAFNIGYPNAFDRANHRTGDFLMVHGKCKSAGCYAMTDALIEEIYALARESFVGGQDKFQVHAMPFRMTDANMARHATSPHAPFWASLKEGYDYFEQTRQLPEVGVCERRYVVNVKWSGGPVSKLNPEGRCPPLERLPLSAFTPPPAAAGQQAAAEIVVPGPRLHDVATSPPPASLPNGGNPGKASAFGLSFGGSSQSALGAAFGLH